MVITWLASRHWVTSSCAEGLASVLPGFIRAAVLGRAIIVPASQAQTPRYWGASELAQTSGSGRRGFNPGHLTLPGLTCSASLRLAPSVVCMTRCW